MPRLGTTSSDKASSLFNDPKFGDCKVVCADGREFHCSKWKLAEQSEFFYKSLSGGWKESNTSHLELEETDSAPIEAMLYYIHTGKYTYPSSTSPTQSSYLSSVTIAQHVSIFATADFYCVDSLKAKARGFFEQEFPRHPVDDKWFEAVEQVYSTTLSREGGLGEIVIKTALQRMYQLSEYPGERWLKLCLQYPDVLRDLFKKLRAGPPPLNQNVVGTMAPVLDAGTSVPISEGIPPMTGSHFGGGGRTLGRSRARGGRGFSRGRGGAHGNTIFGGAGNTLSGGAEGSGGGNHGGGDDMDEDDE